MTPSVQNLVSEITGRKATMHDAEESGFGTHEIVISDEQMQLASAHRAMLHNDDFMAILRADEREARFELGMLDPLKCTELELRMAAAKWKTARERPVEMSKFLVGIENALAEQKKAVEKPKKDVNQFTPD